MEEQRGSKVAYLSLEHHLLRLDMQKTITLTGLIYTEENHEILTFDGLLTLLEENLHIHNGIRALTAAISDDILERYGIYLKDETHSYPSLKGTLTDTYDGFSHSVVRSIRQRVYSLPEMKELQDDLRKLGVFLNFEVSLS